MNAVNVDWQVDGVLSLVFAYKVKKCESQITFYTNACQLHPVVN